MLRHPFAIAFVTLFVSGSALAQGDTEQLLDFNKVFDHAPYTISDVAMSTHEGLTVADWHADSLMWARDPLTESTQGHVDIPRLEAGNVAVQVFTSVTKSPTVMNLMGNTDETDSITGLAIVDGWPLATHDSLFQRSVYHATRLAEIEMRAPQRVKIVRVAADLDAVLEARTRGSKLLAAVLGTEGLHPLEGDLDNVQELFDVGYRIMGLQHFFDNELGGSLHGISDGGLSEFGRDVIRDLDRMQIIIDVAHSSTAVVEDVLSLTTRPVIVSHTGLRGACDSARNIPDDLMVRIAEAGGVVGIGYWEAAVCGTSPEAIVDTIRYAVDLLGVDHVSLGSDFDGTVDTALDTSELAALTHEMIERDFTNEEVTKVMGENIVRFLKENLPGGTGTPSSGGCAVAPGGTSAPSPLVLAMALLALALRRNRR